jgi:hypothetical protein
MISLGAVFGHNRRLKLLASFRAMKCGMLSLLLPSCGTFSFGPEIGDKFDPTQFSWESWLEQFGLMKVSLLRLNPGRVNLATLPPRIAADDGSRDLIRDVL